MTVTVPDDPALLPAERAARSRLSAIAERNVPPASTLSVPVPVLPIPAAFAPTSISDPAPLTVAVPAVTVAVPRLK